MRDRTLIPPRQWPSLAQLLEAAAGLERQNRIAEAEQLYQAILAQQRDQFDALHAFAILRYRQGKVGEAAGLMRRAVTQNPRSPYAQNNLGNALLALGQAAEAVRHYRKALALAPGFAEAHNNLAVALQSLGRLDEAVAQYEKALAVKPDYPDAHNNLGAVLLRLGRGEAAIAHLRKAIALKPDYLEALHNLASGLVDHGKPQEALAYGEKVVALRPDFAEAWNTLGNALHALGRSAEATARFERALVLRPGFAEAHNNLGTALDALGRVEEAQLQYRKAIALSPDYADPHNNLGAILTRLGELGEARGAFERAVALAPRRPLFLANLSDVKRFAPGDRHLALMEELARNMSDLPVDEQARLHFGLGKAYADCGWHDRAFSHLRAGNMRRRRQLPYDEPGTLRRFERIRTVVGRDLIERNRGMGNSSSRPLFVLGMPRSGTTLIEQILASHPRVFGAGELGAFEAAIAYIGGSRGASADFPEWLPDLSGEEWRRLGARYSRLLRSVAPTAERVTDKMPENFRFAGLIHIALPEARIIHARRDPLDTCYSCFSRLFRDGQAYTYDLRELGRYYRAYERLMEHWRQVLPPEVMLDVQYERLVANFEEETRRILDHCGLEWHDACLEFHKLRRPVQTASAAQVRQPLYDSSIGRWRPYQEFLAPLMEELGIAAT